MKLKYLIGIVLILLLALGGCKSGEVVDEEDSNTTTAEGAGGSEEIDVEIEQEITDEQREMDVKDLINQLSEEAGLEVEDESSAISEEVSIVIDRFKGSPADLDIKVGGAVTFVNDQENFKHIIGITPWIDGKYSSKTINNEWHPLLQGESWSYTFEEAGKFRWLSKSHYPDTQGEIEVVE